MLRRRWLQSGGPVEAAAEATTEVGAAAEEVPDVAEADEVRQTRVKTVARVRVKVKEVVKGLDTIQTLHIRAVTTILSMEPELGFVRNPSHVPGKTRSLKDHEGQADLARIIIVKIISSTTKCFPASDQ